MPIYLGNNEINTISLGSNNIKEIFIGNVSRFGTTGTTTGAPNKVLFSHQSVGRNVVNALDRVEVAHATYVADDRIRTLLNSNIQFWDHDYNGQWGAALLAPDGTGATAGYGAWRGSYSPAYGVQDVGLPHLVGEAFNSTATGNAAAWRDGVTGNGYNTVIIKPGYRDIHMTSLDDYKTMLTTVSTWWAANVPNTILCIMTAPPLRSPLDLTYTSTAGWLEANIATAILEVAAYKEFADWLTTTWVGLSSQNRAIDIFTDLTNRSAVDDGVNFTRNIYKSADHHLNAAGSNVVQQLLVDFINGL